MSEEVKQFPDEFDFTEAWADGGQLMNAFKSFMELCSEHGVPVVCHIAVHGDANGVQVSGGVNARNGWLPPVLEDMYSIMNMDGDMHSHLHHYVQCLQAKQTIDVANETFANANLENAMVREVPDAGKDKQH